MVADGEIHSTDFWASVLNPWALWQYAHTMSGAVSLALRCCGGGAFYLLEQSMWSMARLFLASA